MFKKEVDYKEPSFKIKELSKPSPGDVSSYSNNLYLSNKEFTPTEKTFMKGVYTGKYNDEYIPPVSIKTKNDYQEPKKINYTTVFNDEFVKNRYGYHQPTGYELGSVENDLNKGFNMSQGIQTTHDSIPWQGSWGWSGYKFYALNSSKKI